MAFPAFPLLACAAAAAAWLACSGPGDEAQRDGADVAARGSCEPAQKDPLLQGLPALAALRVARRAAPAPVRATERPAADAASAPAPVEPETRTYEIPATPEGWGWLLHVPADVNAAAAAAALAPPRAVHPESVTKVLEGLLASPLRDAGADRMRLRWLAPSRIEVKAPTFAQRVVEDVLARLVWTPAWLGVDLAGAELADMLAAGAPEERAWARGALRRASAELRDAVRAAEDRRGPDPVASPPKALAAGTLELACELRAFRSHDAFMRDVGVDACRWSLGSGSLHPQAPPTRSGRELLDDTQCEVVLRALEKSERVAELGAPRLETLPNGETRWFEVGEGFTLGLQVDLAPRGDGRSQWLVARLSLRRPVGTVLQFVPVGILAMPDGAALLLHPADTLTEEPGPPSTTYVLLRLETLDRAGEDGRLAPDAFSWDPLPAER